MPRSRCSCSRRSRIWAWMVTSSAVVGSSAISRRGLQADGHGDHDPLAHAAGELMGEGIEARGGLRDADLVQQLDGAPAALGAAAALMHAQRLHDLEADGEAGVQARHRLLEDHGDVLADDPPALRRAERRQHDPCRRRSRRSAVTLPGQGISPISASMVTLLPEPDSPTIPRDLALLQREVEILDRMQQAARGLEGDLEIADFDQGHQCFSFGSRASRSPSPIRLKASTVMKMPVQGMTTTQGAASRNSSAVGQHGAPFRRRRAGAEAEEAQRRGIDDRRAEARGSPAPPAARRSSAAPSSASGAACRRRRPARR